MGGLTNRTRQRARNSIPVEISNCSVQTAFCVCVCVLFLLCHSEKGSDIVIILNIACPGAGKGTRKESASSLSLRRKEQASQHRNWLHSSVQFTSQKTIPNTTILEETEEKGRKTG